MRNRTPIKEVENRVDEIGHDLNTANYLAPLTLASELTELLECNTDGTPAERQKLEKKISVQQTRISLFMQRGAECMSERPRNGFLQVKKNKNDMEFEWQAPGTGSLSQIAIKDIIGIISRFLYVCDFVSLSRTTKQFRDICDEVNLPFRYIIFSKNFILISQDYAYVTFKKLKEANMNQPDLSLFSAKNAEVLKELVGARLWS